MIEKVDGVLHCNNCLPVQRCENMPDAKGYRMQFYGNTDRLLNVVAGAILNCPRLNENLLPKAGNDMRTIIEEG